jgi:glutamate-ammonia-ligase adenylyltransferase
VLFETWTANPQLFELLLLLFDRSEFLAEMAIRTPDLVDELVLSGRLGRSKAAPEILKELRHGLKDSDQRLWLRRYHQAEFMRLGLRSILGLADPEQNFAELTALADACLQYAVEVACRQARLKKSPVVVLGLGKLGGCELTYGSDLDVVFVAEDKAAKQLPKLHKLAVAIMDLLGSKTELGIAFAVDARLRPDGDKGLLVNTLKAYEEYYRQRAQLWEIQALTRTRAVAGDLSLGARFQQLAGRLTNFRSFATGTSAAGKPEQTKQKGRTPRPRSTSPGRNSPPSCYNADWKLEIARMRQRIEKERTPAGQDALAFKTGRGGLIDVEFLAQTLLLENGWQEPNTLRALQRARDQQVLSAHDADALLDNYRQLRRLECILRRWSFEGEAVLPADPAPFSRVSVRCGFDTPELFRQALARWRSEIRKVYEKVLPGRQ